MATIEIPAPHQDPATLCLHASGTLSVTRSTYGHWRQRRNTGLRAVLEKLKFPYWPSPPENRKDVKAEAEYRRACERAFRRGRDRRRSLQAFLMDRTDRRITAGTDEAARSFRLAAAVLRGEPVSRAAQREADTDLVDKAGALTDEIDTLGLADDPAVRERLQALIADLERQEAEVKAALAEIDRYFGEDQKLVERVGLKAAAVFARIDAHHQGLSDEAAELHAKKMLERWRAA